MRQKFYKLSDEAADLAYVELVCKGYQICGPTTEADDGSLHVLMANSVRRWVNYVIPPGEWEVDHEATEAYASSPRANKYWETLLDR